MQIIIETERLILRNLIPDDYEAAFSWCGDPEVNTYLIYPLYTRKEDVKTWIESRNPDDPNNYDFGFERKDTGELIGCGGYVYHSENNTWKIGYNIRKDQWGQGYVVEAMQGILKEIKKTRTVETIEGIFASENHKSQRVMEKLGMSYVRDTEYKKLDGSQTFQAKVFQCQEG